MRVQALVALNLAGVLAAWSTGPVIGIAVANGTFQVDNAQVSGNSTLFDGSRVETTEASSRLRLRDGTRVELAAGSRAAVFQNRTLLEKGFGEFQAAPSYQIEARGLRISSAGGRSIVRVRLDGEKTVLIAALNGPARVFKTSGPLIANVTAGASLRFEPQAQPESAARMSGCLLRKAGRFILVEQTANVVVELRGDAAQLSAQLGNRVEIQGAVDASGQPVEGASQVVRVSALEQIGPGGCVAAAQGVGAELPTRAPVPAAAAKPKHTGAVIAGVAIAGGAGAIAGVVLMNSNKSKSP
ncbi:MAG: hypothetical protein ABSD27_00995 [Bryobacteraceae bacterium]|jgi:hypothetical protein